MASTVLHKHAGAGLAWLSILAVGIAAWLIAAWRWTARDDDSPESETTATEPVWSDTHGQAVMMLDRVDARIRTLREVERQCQQCVRTAEVTLTLETRVNGAGSLSTQRLTDRLVALRSDCFEVHANLENLLDVRDELVELHDRALNERGELQLFDRSFLGEVERVLLASPLASRNGQLASSSTTSFSHSQPQVPGAQAMTKHDPRSTSILDALSPPARAKLFDMDIVFDVQLPGMDLDALDLPEDDVRIIRAGTATMTPDVPPDIRPLVGGIPSDEVDPLTEDLR